MSLSEEEFNQVLAQISEAQTATQKQQEDKSAAHLPASYAKGIEPLLNMVTSSLADIPAGYAGLGKALFYGADAGVETLRNVQDALTYKPQTAYGREGVEELANSPAVKWLNDAVETVRTKAGDRGYEVTGGSPLAGAIATVVPEGVLELAGVGLGRRLMPKDQFFDANGLPSEALAQELRKLGIDYDDLSTEARALIPNSPPGRIGGRDNAARGALMPSAAAQVKTGNEPTLAGSSPKVTSTKLGLGEPSLLPYPNAQKAADLMDDPGLIQMIKTATPETRAAMLEMLDIRRRTQGNARASQSIRSTDVSGGAVVDRIEYLAEIAGQNRSRLDEIANKELAGVQTNVAPVAEAYFELLNKSRVRLNDDGSFNFEDSIFKPAPGAQSILNRMNDVLSKDTVDAGELHIMKRQLDELIAETKGKAGATGNAGSFLARMRAEINAAIRSINPEYAAVNDELSQTLTVFDDLNNAVGSKIDIFDVTADQKLGQELRKLFSNYGSRVDIGQSIRELENVATLQGAEFGSSAGDLAKLASSLNRRLGDEAEGSLRGIIQSSSNPRGTLGYDAADIVLESAAPGGGVMLNKIKNMFKEDGATNAEIMSALETLIKELGTGE